MAAICKCGAGCRHRLYAMRPEAADDGHGLAQAAALPPFENAGKPWLVVILSFLKVLGWFVSCQI